MNPEEISRQADRKRGQQQQASSDQENGEKAQHASSGFYVFSRIYSRGFNILVWIYMVAMLGGALSLAYLMINPGPGWMLYTGLTLLGAFLVRLTVHGIVMYSRYLTYKSWLKSSSFPLYGWEKLGAHENFPKDGYWCYHASMEVKLKPEATAEATKVVEDALFLFTEKTHRWYYKTIGMDGRTTWGIEAGNPLKVKGSAGGGITGEMYECMHQHLESIQAKYSCIESVHVYFDLKPVFIKGTPAKVPAT